MNFDGTISLTFGDQAENHAGMQLLGTPAKRGLPTAELRAICSQLSQQGLICELIQLDNLLPVELRATNEASVLIVRNYLSASRADVLLAEQLFLKPDTTALMRGRVVNKLARYNLCYDKTAQVADIASGRGTVVAFSTVPQLNLLKCELEKLCNTELVCEMNLYYDIKRCGIGYQGDRERKLVFCMRLGRSMPLHYTWFHQCKPVSGTDTAKLTLNHGDLYIMSEKATGNDWRKRTKYTLRHAAGAAKYLAMRD